MYIFCSRHLFAADKFAWIFAGFIKSDLRRQKANAQAEVLTESVSLFVARMQDVGSLCPSENEPLFDCCSHKNSAHNKSRSSFHCLGFAC